MAYDVFISHSTLDKIVSDVVCASLENARLRCWIAPRDVQLGRSFAGEITRAIQQSRVMVLIFSAHSNNSEQVLREVQLAVGAHLHIIQFRIEDVLPNDDLKYYLSTPHWLDALTPPLEKHLERLTQAIKSLLEAPVEGFSQLNKAGDRESTSATSIHRQIANVQSGTRHARLRWPWLPIAITAALVLTGLIFLYSRTHQKLPSTVQSSTNVSNEVVVEFPDVDTNSAPGHSVAALPYLHRLGISVTNVQPENSEIILVNNRGLYQGAAVMPTTSQNLLTQGNTGNVPASFTLNFEHPARSVSFTRPELYPATQSGITHPAWSVHALDTQGNELSSQSEGVTRCLNYSFAGAPPCEKVPAQKYILRAPAFSPIAAVRFDSDPRLNGKPFAAFSAILIERLTLVY